MRAEVGERARGELGGDCPWERGLCGGPAGSEALLRGGQGRSDRGAARAARSVATGPGPRTQWKPVPQCLLGAGGPGLCFVSSSARMQNKAPRSRARGRTAPPTHAPRDLAPPAVCQPAGAFPVPPAVRGDVLGGPAQNRPAWWFELHILCLGSYLGKLYLLSFYNEVKKVKSLAVWHGFRSQGNFFFFAGKGRCSVSHPTGRSLLVTSARDL